MDSHQHHLMQGITEAPTESQHVHGTMDHMMSMAVSNFYFVLVFESLDSKV